MKYLRSVPILIFLGILSVSSHAQNPLPDFMLRELTKGKVQISWNNPYETCIQISVQRSADSLNDFRTIFSSLSPELPANGFVDNKPLLGIKSYYRLFYVLQGGAYYFSSSTPVYIRMTNPVIEMPLPNADSRKRTINAISDQSPISIYIRQSEVFKLNKDQYNRFKDSINKTSDLLRRINDHTVEWVPAQVRGNKKIFTVFQKNEILGDLTETAYERFKDSIASKTKDSLYVIDQTHIQLRPFVIKPDYISVFRNDSLLVKLQIPQYKKFRDSLAMRTRDTLFYIDNYHLEIHPYTVKYAWQQSSYVFTNSKGYVKILLPLVKQHRYRIVFYDDDSSELFQIKSLKETELLLDKTNFIHAGWFSFELFEDDRLKEKNKFFLSRD